MDATDTPRAPLTDAELQELLSLMQGSDSVELKVTVPESDHQSAVRSLGLDPLAAQIRQIYFFDTPDLAANKAGVVVRARRIQGKGDDSVIKLRPVVPAELSPELRQTSGFSVEVDAMPGGFVCSASMRREPGKADVKATLAGAQRLHSLFSREQRAFYAAHAPDGIALDDLSVLGPIFVLKLRFTPEELAPRRIVAEMWWYPDGSRLLELSTKCSTTEGFQVAAEARAFLAGRGVSVSGEQSTKTRKALEYFAAIVRGGPA